MGHGDWDKHWQQILHEVLGVICRHRKKNQTFAKPVDKNTEMQQDSQKAIAQWMHTSLESGAQSATHTHTHTHTHILVLGKQV